MTDADIDIFDREAIFIERHMRGLVKDHPKLKVVMEHITSAEAVKFVTYVALPHSSLLYALAHREALCRDRDSGPDALSTAFSAMTYVCSVREQGPNVAATITCQHLIYTRSAIFAKGLNPHKVRLLPYLTRCI